MAAGGFQLGLRFGGKRFNDAARGLRAFARQAERNVKDLNPVIRRQMVDLVDTITLALQQRHSASWSPGQTLPTGGRTGRLAKRSGMAMAALRSFSGVSGSGANISGDIRGPGWLLVHEDGKVIRPRRRQYLAIPLPPALDSRGVPKRRGPRQWQNTFVARSRKGNLLIFQKGSGGDITPLYLLTKQVRIPARLGMKETVEVAVPVFEDRLFDDLTRTLLKGL